MKYSEYHQKLMTNTGFSQAEEQLQHRFALGNSVLAARIRMGWSQTELAKRVGTRQANISRIEAGLSNPTLDLIARICQAQELDVLFMHKVSQVTPNNNVQYHYNKAFHQDEVSSPTRISDAE